MHTYASALALSAVAVPAHLDADVTVPILSGPQAQGDLMIIPVTAGSLPYPRLEPLPSAGIRVVHGEATGNTHWLHAGFESPDVRWASDLDGVRLGYLLVPDAQSALLVHTGEHGANGIAPCTYAIHRKREHAVLVEHAPFTIVAPRLVED
jgi:hypothetical protein